MARASTMLKLSKLAQNANYCLDRSFLIEPWPRAFRRKTFLGQSSRLCHRMLANRIRRRASNTWPAKFCCSLFTMLSCFCPKTEERQPGSCLAAVFAKLRLLGGSRSFDNVETTVAMRSLAACLALSRRERAVVEPIGIEPMTSCLQSTRSPS